MKKSILWNISKKELEDKIQASNSFGKILKEYGLMSKGGNVKTLKNVLISKNINFNHIKLGINSNISRKFNHKKLTLEECNKKIFIENCKSSRRCLKKYLLYYKIIPYKCNDCKLDDVWNDKKLVLQIDHINGIENDNRLLNLRWLCPNCHSQTSTFAGRNKNYKCN